MTEPEALQKRRQFLLNQLCKLADEISRIDKRLDFLGRKPGSGASI